MTKVDISVMLLERGIRDILRVLVLTRNSVYSVCLVEDTIPPVYKMEGYRSFVGCSEGESGKVN